MKARLDLTSEERDVLEFMGIEYLGARKKRDGSGYFVYVENIEYLHYIVAKMRYQFVKPVPASFHLKWNTPFVKCSVRGVNHGYFKYDERERSYWKRITAGDRFILERELNNEHDSNAIKVLGRDKYLVGYIERDIAAQLAPLLDSGSNFEVVSLENNSRSWSLDVIIVGTDLPSDIATIAQHPHA